MIALVGLIGRILYVVWVRSSPVGGDGYQYHSAALALVDGAGFINPLARDFLGKMVPDAVHPPAWTLLLAAASALGLRSYLAHQIVACLLGAAVIAMTGLAGRAAFGARVGLIAAGLAAVYPNVWLYERDVAVEPLAMLGTATTLWLAYRYRAAPSVGLAAALGAAVALLALTRSELIAISLLLVTPLILFSADGNLARRVARLTLAGAVSVVCIAPWSLFNLTRFALFVPLSNGLGSALRAGNCSATYDGERLGADQFACLLFVPKLSEEPSIADRQYRQAALTFIWARIDRLPVVIAARLGRTFNMFRPFQQVHFEAERGTAIAVLWVALFSYWLLLPFAAAGGLIARRRGVMIYPLLAFPAVAVLSVALTIGAVRYRAPSEVPLVLLAALSFDALLRWRARPSAESGDASPPHPDRPSAAARPALDAVALPQNAVSDQH